MAVSATSTPLTGLPRRLVQDGIVDEDTVLAAVRDARKEKVGFVAHLVSNKRARSRSPPPTNSACR
ncbi:MAG: hypothetical protein ACE5FM_05125 [Methyloligellaceae bacterium]